MGNCSSSEAVNPNAVDLTHFDLMKVVGQNEHAHRGKGSGNGRNGTGE